MSHPILLFTLHQTFGGNHLIFVELLMNIKWVEGGSLYLDFLISLFNSINRINVRTKDVCVSVCVCVENNTYWGMTHWELRIVQRWNIACELSWSFTTQSKISSLVLVSCSRTSQRSCPVTLTLWSHARIKNANCTLSLMSSDFILGFGRRLKIWHFVFSGQRMGRSLSIPFIIHAIVFFDRRTF